MTTPEISNEQLNRIKKAAPAERFAVIEQIRAEMEEAVTVPEELNLDMKPAKTLLLKYLPEECDELQIQATDLFDMFMAVHNAGYTGVGGLDLVINQFNGNEVYIQFRDVLYSRFLCTYGAVVGRKGSDQRKNKKSQNMPQDIALATMWNTVEDILFSMYRAPIPEQFYIDLVDMHS